MSSGGPTRSSDSLADVVEMLLDKGVVINADIVVSIGDTELLGVQLRAAIASFETAAEYGLEFPDGTDMRRVEQASGRSELSEDEDTVTAAVEDVGEAIATKSASDENDEDTENEASDRPTGVSDGGESDADDADDEAKAEGTDDDG